MRALRVELEKALDANEVHLVGMEIVQNSGWIVIDAFDVMIHLFLAESREKYGLERLWRDAVEIPVARILAPAAKSKREKKPRVAASAKPRAKRSRP
jgi:ribosome-associated protein